MKSVTCKRSISCELFEARLIPIEAGNLDAFAAAELSTADMYRGERFGTLGRYARPMFGDGDDANSATAEFLRLRKSYRFLFGALYVP